VVLLERPLRPVQRHLIQAPDSDYEDNNNNVVEEKSKSLRTKRGIAKRPRGKRAAP